MSDGSGHRSVDPIAAIVTAVAAWGIGEEEGPLLPDGVSLPSAPAEQLSLAAELQRTRLLGPMLAAATLGEIHLPEDLHDQLRSRQEAALMWCLLLEVRLLEVREWFDDAGGIEHLVVKGPAIAHLDALDPSVRTFADVDLLVAQHDIDRAVGVLADHGATRPWDQRRPGWDRRFAKSITLTFPDGIEFDVHRTLADGVLGHRIPLDDIFSHSEQFDIGGVMFRAPGAPHRLLHSAYHLTLGSPEPSTMSLRDLAEYLGQPALEPDAVVEIARVWRGESVLAMAIDLLAERLGADVVERSWMLWRTSYRPPAREVELIQRHRREGSSLGRAKLDVLRELPGARERAAYLTALAWPSSGHLRSRGLRRRDALGSIFGMAGKALPRRRPAAR